MPRAHMKRPCENCPYRIDAPRKLWHRTEFENVLAAEVSDLGTIFSCHKEVALPPEKRGFCAGWLLDQKKRAVPSIALRLSLMKDADSGPALDAVNGKGLRLFKTVEAMCAANGIGQKTIRRLGRRTCALCRRALSVRESKRGIVCARCRHARATVGRASLQLTRKK